MDRDLCGEKMKVTDLPIQAYNHFDHLALKNWVAFLYIQPGFRTIFFLTEPYYFGPVSILTEINQ